MGRPDADQIEIEEAARVANAHSFIVKLPDGFDTQVSWFSTLICEYELRNPIIGELTEFLALEGLEMKSPVSQQTNYIFYYNMCEILENQKNLRYLFKVKLELES